MLRRPGRLLLLVAAALIVLLLVGGALTGLYTDALWYSGVGYGGVFWTRLAATAAVRLVVGGLGAAFVALNLSFGARQPRPVQLRRRSGNLESSEHVPPRYITLGIAAAAVLAGWWLSWVAVGGGGALAILAWLRHVAWGATGPLLGLALSCSVFQLPAFYRLDAFSLLRLLWSILLVLIGYVLAGGVRLRDGRPEVDST